MTQPLLCRSESSPYHALAQSLFEEILSGNLKPGEKLPPSREIAASNGVCMSTVQRALYALERERLINTNRNKKRITSDVDMIEHWKNQYIVAQLDFCIKKLHCIGVQNDEISKNVVAYLKTSAAFEKDHRQKG